MRSYVLVIFLVFILLVGCSKVPHTETPIDTNDDNGDDGGIFDGINDIVDDFINNVDPCEDDCYNIIQFGAVANDGKDDIIAFDRILGDHYRDIKIFVPEGEFNIGEEISFSGTHYNIELYGAGKNSIIKSLSSSTGNVIRVNGAKKITIKDLTVDGNKAGREAIGTGFYSDDLTVDNVVVKNAKTTGIAIVLSNNAVIKDCEILNSGDLTVNTHSQGMAIALFGASNMFVDNNEIKTFYGDGGIFTAGVAGKTQATTGTIRNNDVSDGYHDQGSDIHIYQGEDIKILNNKCHDNQLGLKGVNGIFTGPGASNIIIDGNDVYQVTGVGVEVNAKNSIARNNNIHNFKGTGQDAQGVYIAADNSIIQNNHIEESTRHGIFIHKDYTNMQIIDNEIIDSCKPGLNTECAGIRIIIDAGTNTGLIIEGNTIKSTKNPPTQLYGIYKTGYGTLSNPIIQNNNINTHQKGQIVGT